MVKRNANIKEWSALWIATNAHLTNMTSAKPFFVDFGELKGLKNAGKGMEVKMPTVTIEIIGEGTVKVSKDGVLHGTANQPLNNFTFGLWDKVMFQAFPNKGYQFSKFCSANNSVCGNSNQNALQATIDTPHDVLLAYFIPQPSNPIEWLWNLLFG
jgi:hypothetical protein